MKELLEYAKKKATDNVAFFGIKMKILREEITTTAQIDAELGG